MNDKGLTHKPFLALASERGLRPSPPEPDRRHADEQAASLRRRRVVPSWQRRSESAEAPALPLPEASEPPEAGELVQLELPAVAVATEDSDNQEAERVAGKRRKNLTVEQKRTLIQRVNAIRVAREKKLEPPETTVDIAKEYGVGVSYVYNLVSEHKKLKHRAKKASKRSEKPKPVNATIEPSRSRGSGQAVPSFLVTFQGPALEAYIDSRVQLALQAFVRRGVG